MKVTNPKPRFGSKFVRQAFVQHFVSRKVDDKRDSLKKRLLRAMVISKEFVAIIKRRLFGSILWLEYCCAEKCWLCYFEEIFGESFTEEELLLIFALAKPKLRQLGLDSSLDAPSINEQLTHYLSGIPKLSIYASKDDPHSLALIKKMAPNLSSLVCPLEHLHCKLPPMKLEICEVKCFGDSTINLGPLFSKHQIRQILLSFHNNFNDDQIVCGGRSLNLSVEELYIKSAEKSPVHLPKRLLKRLPNLKRVFLFWRINIWDDDFDYYQGNDKLRASIECAKECVRKSPNLRVVFDVHVEDSYSDPDVYLGKLREHGLLGDEEHSFVSKEELKDDLDIKSCPCYEWKNPRILVRSTGQIKCFFWRF